MKTTNNTMLITGGETGMGLEAAKQFSNLGNKVIMVFGILSFELHTEWLPFLHAKVGYR